VKLTRKCEAEYIRRFRVTVSGLELSLSGLYTLREEILHA
jgi:hypothetical protein